MADYNGDLQVVIAKQDSVMKKLDKMDAKMDVVCDTVSRHDEKIKTNDKEITSLRKKSDTWNAGNSIGILISYVAAAFGIHEAGG